MKRSASSLRTLRRGVSALLALILAAFTIGCAADKPAPEPTAAPNETIAPIETAAPTDTPAPDGPLPEVRYDEQTATLRIIGESGYDRITLPTEAENAEQLIVEDDDFELNVDLKALRDGGRYFPEDITGYIDRTEKSFAFIKDYLKKNAPSVYDEAFAEYTVSLNINMNTEDYGTTVEDDRIILNSVYGYWYRDYQYLLAMLNSKPIGWEQLGYVAYVWLCIDPYNEIMKELQLTDELPYYQACINKGIDPDNITLSDMRIYLDAVSRVCLDRGLGEWGSSFESRKLFVLEERTRTVLERTDKGDEKLSLCMAASLIAFLDDAWGFDTVSRFVFGQISFEEAFGTDFETVFNEWKTLRIDSYISE